MRTPFSLILALSTAAAPVTAQTLDIYFIDVEGGQATLYVSPEGESMLVDTGNPGERDHNRIMEVLDLAGVSELDHLVLTHYHGDHYGGLEALASRMPIHHFYDHGSSVEQDRPQVQDFERRYAEIHSQAQRTVPVPGDRIAFAGTEVVVVSAHGEILQDPIEGARGVGAMNPGCAHWSEIDESQARDPDNDSSLGFVMSYGEFRTTNLGDLTWNREGWMMCPNNPIGTVDLHLTSHHGLDRSGSSALIYGLAPRVIVMNNGTRKGGNVGALEVIHASPGLENLWQLHWSYHGGAEHNAPGVFIANLDEPSQLAAVLDPSEGDPPVSGDAAHSPAHWIQVSAQADGTFTVTNSRNGFTKTYHPHRP